jgi:hypothetical protein
LRCAKCSQPLAESAPLDNAGLKRLLHDLPLTEDDWSLEAQLRSVERLVSSLREYGPTPRPSIAVDEPHAGLAGWHAPAEPRTQLTDTKPATHTAAWSILSLGLAVFACGGVLLVWSLVAGREDLWPVGMPLALIGQAGLILGLILQLDGLWHTSRSTAKALTQLDDELANVRQATTLLSTARSNPSQSFYLHLAEGAAPQLLLADLKGQLDLLAQQMAQKK